MKMPITGHTPCLTRLLGRLLLIWLSLGLTLPTAQALSYDDIQDKGEIAIAVYRDFPPFSYRRDGKLVGIDIDIAHHIARQLNVRLNLIEQTADENVDDDLRNAIWKGHYLGGAVADVMLHVPYDRELALRNDLVVLFGPYLKEEIIAARNIEKLGRDATLALFRYEKIAVELDSLADLYLSGAFGGSIRANLLHFKTTEEAGQAALRGEAAGLMGPRSQVQYALLAGMDRFDLGKVPTPGLIKADWLIGAAVKNNYRQLGYAVEDIIASMVRDGLMAEIFKRHSIDYVAPSLDYLAGAGVQ
ncbi:substrate-binding periplasmic protein [Sedimenticola sp.]|uniref:substrate-binding periplasmic protein n=1 Tax=Sedimenticola sp. TaxID=1940285 RepID=UPI00258E8470|nr:transporter substrate-binding domain-containing protein [Sedimenticola sp.]MCW8904641.1 transporter substrate-binding domain-containing protein [Sedimenticola sp.]